MVAPLMPKATAVWLVENTALSFDQVADFCKLHPLEVKAIADGDAAQGIKGLDPVLTGQLSRDEFTKFVEQRKPKTEGVVKDKKVNALFDVLDVDQNGSLSLEEFKRAGELLKVKKGK